MSPVDANDVTSRSAAELRRAFDRSFAEPPVERVTQHEDFLAIGVGQSAFALRLRDVRGLFADKSLTPLPTPVPELLGVAGFRGALVPVYDLRALLGETVTPATPRWMVLVQRGEPNDDAASTCVALAFDRFEGHLRMTQDEVAKGAAGDSSRDVVRAQGIARPIVEVSSLFDLIERNR